MTQLLCYVRRDRLTSWKLDALKRGRNGDPIPAYGSNDALFGKYAQPGSVLWVVGPTANGRLSLEARIHVRKQIQRPTEWKWEVAGTQAGSRFFGLNDVSDAVGRLWFANGRTEWSLGNGSSAAEWRPSFGRRFQGPRRIVSDDSSRGRRSSPAAAFEELATRLVHRTLFLSWKHRDNGLPMRRFLRALVYQLCRRGFNVWWDKAAFTGVYAMNEYASHKRDDLMHNLLRLGLLQSSAILALWTKNYGLQSPNADRNWTRDEWNTKRTIPRIAIGATATIGPKVGLKTPQRIISLPQSPSVPHAVGVAGRIAHAFESLTR
jgi:hypothetical protein